MAGVLGLSGRHTGDPSEDNKACCHFYKSVPVKSCPLMIAADLRSCIPVEWFATRRPFPNLSFLLQDVGTVVHCFLAKNFHHCESVQETKCLMHLVQENLQIVACYSGPRRLPR